MSDDGDGEMARQRDGVGSRTTDEHFVSPAMRAICAPTVRHVFNPDVSLATGDPAEGHIAIDWELVETGCGPS